jgi:hypothetical protein
MDIKLDDKRIKEIVYQLEDGRVVRYNFKDGEINYIQLVNEGVIEKTKEIPTDSEMIDKIRKCEFMNELEDARKRFKISKAIADTFPDKDDDGNIKTPNRKYSDESLSIAKEIIKMDKEGKLDEILKRHGTKTIGDIIKRLEEPLVDSELSDDSAACQKNLDTIERKLLARLRMDGEDTANDDEFKKLLDNYNFYKSKKKEIDDKLWKTTTKPIK